MSDSEIIYREGYTEGYQQAIKDVTAYKIPKITAKKFSIDEFKKWENFEDDYYEVTFSNFTIGDSIIFKFMIIIISKNLKFYLCCIRKKIIEIF